MKSRPAPVALLHSGGKDSILALAALRALRDLEVRALVTTFTEPEGALAMHRVPRELIEAQAASLGLPLFAVTVPADAPNDVYEDRLAEVLSPLAKEGVRMVATGDLFLEDIRAYREALLARLGLAACFPLWGTDSATLAGRFVESGYRGVVVCVDGSQLDADLSGSALDQDFFTRLPAEVDPCGENGEYQSFVFDGPGFAFPVRFTISGRGRVDRFHYALLRSTLAARCARCAAPFDCGAQRIESRCWCAEIPAVTPEAGLSECLCPRCLRQALARGAG